MNWIKTALGNSAFVLLRRIKNQYKRNQQSKLKVLNQKEFEGILIDDIGITSGDTLLIHSSLDKINLSFSPFEALNIIQEIIGTNGTVAFPTYPLGYSYDFLKQNKIFNQKLTPSSTGILSEVARRHKNAFRSLHPTKSVSAIGLNAEEITNTHHLSPYPYDSNSPYFKIYKYNAKIIGLGIKSTYLSCVHTVDDTYKNDFIVDVYHKQLFEARCITKNKEEIIVKTYAHDMNKMIFNLPQFFDNHIDNSTCKDFKVFGYNFFKADARKLYDEMIDLYETKKLTIYPKSIYKRML